MEKEGECYEEEVQPYRKTDYKPKKFIYIISWFSILYEMYTFNHSPRLPPSPVLYQTVNSLALQVQTYVDTHIALYYLLDNLWTRYIGKKTLFFFMYVNYLFIYGDYNAKLCTLMYMLA